MNNAPFTHCAGCCHYYNGVCNSIEKCEYQVGEMYKPLSNEDLIKVDMDFLLYEKDEEKTVEQVMKLVKEAVYDYCSEFVGSAVWRAIVKHLDDNDIEVQDEQ